MANQEPSLKQSLYEILHGLQNEQHWRETGEGLQRVRNAIPGVAESVARGAIASVPGSVGDISEFARTVAPETMESTFGRRVAPTTREILDYVPRITPTHEGATTLEDVGAAIAPGVGGVTKDVALLTKGKHMGLSIMGPESALWNKEMAFNAGKMEAKGVAPEEILQKTGMVRGLDGQWRSELSDQFSKLKTKGDMFSEHYMNAKDIDLWSVFMMKAEEAKYGRSPPELHKMTAKEFDNYRDFRLKTLDEHKALEQKPVMVKDVLEHPQLFEAYPHLSNIKLEVGSGHGGQRGSYNHGKNTITLAAHLSPEEARSTLLHELTHGIQAKEGYNRGGNPDMFTHQKLAQELKQNLEIRGVADVVKKGMPNATEEEMLAKLENLYKNKGLDQEYIKKALDRDYWTDEIAQKIVKDYGLDTGRAFPYTKEEMYKNLAGEAEARMVQNRLDLSPEELRQKFPYQYAPKNHGLDIDPDVANVISDRGQLINEPSYSYEYRGAHKAPGNDDYHSPAHELDRGMYPEDVYGPNGHHYYGTGNNKMDREVLATLREARNNPDHPITVYRAVPGEFKDQDINPGDWVTPSMDYAHQHGLGWDSHHIIEKTVPAKHLWTEGNSLHEFGYDPTE
jgi:hypothetical protein